MKWINAVSYRNDEGAFEFHKDHECPRLIEQIGGHAKLEQDKIPKGVVYVLCPDCASDS